MKKTNNTSVAGTTENIISMVAEKPIEKCTIKEVFNDYKKKGTNSRFAIYFNEEDEFVVNNYLDELSFKGVLHLIGKLTNKYFVLSFEDDFAPNNVILIPTTKLEQLEEIINFSWAKFQKDKIDDLIDIIKKELKDNDKYNGSSDDYPIQINADYLHHFYFDLIDDYNHSDNMLFDVSDYFENELKDISMANIQWDYINNQKYLIVE